MADGLVVVVVAGAVFPADVSPIRQAILNNDDAYQARVARRYPDPEERAAVRNANLLSLDYDEKAPGLVPESFNRPVFFYVGSNDAWIDLMRRTARALPNCRYVEIESEDRIPTPISHADELISQILEFIEEVEHASTD